jgi:5-methyltetrahydrofolate--homocysteine methyltransferase
MKRFVEEYGVSVVGGCCGSSPEHIRALVSSLQDIKPLSRELSL